VRDRSQTGVIISSSLESSIDQNPLVITDLDASSQSVSDTDGSAPRRTQTYNQLIKSQPVDFHNAWSCSTLCIETKPLGHLMATDTCQVDSALAAIVDAWPTLPEAFKTGIVAMVKATSK
jgi:hypothetical protein